MPGNTLRVLVVEDTFSNLKMLEAKLLGERFEVEVALDGAEALRKIAAQTFDIVLLDVMMPGLDGFEVCRRIKTGRETGDLPVIMVTALDSLADRQLGMDAGADDFFVKPVEDRLLFGRMIELTDRANVDASARDAWARQV
jgi:two-component system, cell cycle response regulator